MMRFDEFVTALYDAGWRPVLDAQHSEIKKLWENACPTLAELENELADSTDEIERLRAALSLHESPRSPTLAEGEEAGRGPWKVDEWPDGRVVVQSENFTHDAALEITGDFATPEEKRQYAEQIARRLNCPNQVPGAPRLAALE